MLIDDDIIVYRGIIVRYGAIRLFLDHSDKFRRATYGEISIYLKFCS